MPSRIDFRELVKELVKELKLRIELRQISLRERTAAIGGIGYADYKHVSEFSSSFATLVLKMQNQTYQFLPTE